MVFYHHVYKYIFLTDSIKETLFGNYFWKSHKNSYWVIRLLHLEAFQELKNTKIRSCIQLNLLGSITQVVTRSVKLLLNIPYQDFASTRPSTASGLIHQKNKNVNWEFALHMTWKDPDNNAEQLCKVFRFEKDVNISHDKLSLERYLCSGHFHQKKSKV